MLPEPSWLACHHQFGGGDSQKSHGIDRSCHALGKGGSGGQRIDTLTIHRRTRIQRRSYSRVFSPPETSSCFHPTAPFRAPTLSTTRIASPAVCTSAEKYRAGQSELARAWVLNVECWMLNVECRVGPSQPSPPTPRWSPPPPLRPCPIVLFNLDYLCLLTPTHPPSAKTKSLADGNLISTLLEQVRLFWMCSSRPTMRPLAVTAPTIAQSMPTPAAAAAAAAAAGWDWYLAPLQTTSGWWGESMSRLSHRLDVVGRVIDWFVITWVFVLIWREMRRHETSMPYGFL